MLIIDRSSISPLLVWIQIMQIWISEAHLGLYKWSMVEIFLVADVWQGPKASGLL